MVIFTVKLSFESNNNYFNYLVTLIIKLPYKIFR